MDRYRECTSTFNIWAYISAFCEFRLKAILKQYIEWIFCTQNPWTAILPLPVYIFNVWFKSISHNSRHQYILPANYLTAVRISSQHTTVNRYFWCFSKYNFHHKKCLNRYITRLYRCLKKCNARWLSNYRRCNARWIIEHKYCDLHLTICSRRRDIVIIIIVCPYWPKMHYGITFYQLTVNCLWGKSVGQGWASRSLKARGDKSSFQNCQEWQWEWQQIIDLYNIRIIILEGGGGGGTDKCVNIRLDTFQ